MDLMPVKQVGVCCLKIHYKFLWADNSREIALPRLSQQLYSLRVGSGGIFVVLKNTLKIMERFVAVIFSGILKYSGKSAENEGNFIKKSRWQSRVNHPAG
jgi:hypothetical protein